MPIDIARNILQLGCEPDESYTVDDEERDRPRRQFLRATSLISKAWVIPSQQLLWSRLELPSYSVFRALRQSPALKHYRLHTRHVVLIDTFEIGDCFVCPINILSHPSLKNITTLILEDVWFTSTLSVPATMTSLHTLTMATTRWMDANVEAFCAILKASAATLANLTLGKALSRGVSADEYLPLYKAALTPILPTLRSLELCDHIFMDVLPLTLGLEHLRLRLAPRGNQIDHLAALLANSDCQLKTLAFGGTTFEEKLFEAVTGSLRRTRGCFELVLVKEIEEKKLLNIRGFEEQKRTL
ncbi:hypothetical protein MNV49_002359 [Pseudohyphozyma bogoriensis]|nr:hypothetical protein MNV49_002359 [Pseudohyphozyma bogoriensis]